MDVPCGNELTILGTPSAGSLFFYQVKWKNNYHYGIILTDRGSLTSIEVIEVGDGAEVLKGRASF